MTLADITAYGRMDDESGGAIAIVASSFRARKKETSSTGNDALARYLGYAAVSVAKQGATLVNHEMAHQERGIRDLENEAT